MFNKSFLFVAAIVLLMLSASNMAQQAAVPATLPAGQNSRAELTLVRGRTQPRIQDVVVRFKTEFNTSDEDLAILSPLIQKCLDARFAAYLSDNLTGYGTKSMATGPQGLVPRMAGPVTGQALLDLDRLLSNKDTPLPDIQAQMALIRKLHQQADDDYTAACKELRSHVTRRQEAFLFLNDVLD
jgi:hypothetical protein